MKREKREMNPKCYTYLEQPHTKQTEAGFKFNQQQKCIPGLVHIIFFLSWMDGFRRCVNDTDFQSITLNMYFQTTERMQQCTQFLCFISSFISSLCFILKIMIALFLKINYFLLNILTFLQALIGMFTQVHQPLLNLYIYYSFRSVLSGFVHKSD